MDFVALRIKDDCEVDGLVILDVPDGVFDVSVKLEVGYVGNAVEESNDV